MRKFFPLFVIIVFVATLAACSGLPDLIGSAEREAVQKLAGATATPQVIIVVATPTVAAPAAQPAAVEQPPAPRGTMQPPAPIPEAPLPVREVDSEEARRVAVYEHVSPAVVNITTQVLTSDFFFGGMQSEGSGSGFLWDEQGHIVTNYHVVQGAQQISVSFGNDVNEDATVVGTDPQNDLAVLKVDSLPQGVEPVQVGTSTGLKVGQSAYAIGNPFGQFERTMTQGIISALNRTIQTDNNSVLRGVIQTDAAINRGNSGGPLLDSSGRLIGVNSAIYSPTGTSAGVGLAIPVDKVKLVVPELIQNGRYPHPWLGVEELGYEISPALARGLNLPVTEGLLVARAYQGSPADQAGIRTAQDQVILGNRRYLVGGDILTAIDGRKLTKWDQLSEYLDEEAKVGQTVTLDVMRDGKAMQLRATLADTPQQLLQQ